MDNFFLMTELSPHDSFPEVGTVFKVNNRYKLTITQSDLQENEGRFKFIYLCNDCDTDSVPLKHTVCPFALETDDVYENIIVCKDCYNKRKGLINEKLIQG